MSDPDGDFEIDVSSCDELRFWARHLGTDLRTLVGAVMTVGPMLAKVTEYLETREARQERPASGNAVPERDLMPADAGEEPARFRI